MDPVFRAPMRARSHDAPPGVGAEHGLARDVVGIGDTDEARIGRFGAVPEGVFVWTRDTDGMYWLDRPFGEDEVPAGVAATFARGGRNFQRTHDADAERLTAALWERFG